MKIQTYKVQITHGWIDNYTKPKEIENAIREYLAQYFLAFGAVKVRVTEIKER